MSKHWGPREPLDMREGSLLRSIGLSEKSAIAILAVWIVICVGVGIARVDDAPLAVMALLFGALAIRYITARLGGRPAIATFVGDTVTESEDAFQVRLIMDIAMIALLILCISLLAGGRPLLIWVKGLI